MNRLFFFCAEYTRRTPRPVQPIDASSSTHVLGFAMQRPGEDFEKLVADLREIGLRDTQPNPDEWRYVATTYQEVGRDDLRKMYEAITGEELSGHVAR